MDLDSQCDSQTEDRGPDLKSIEGQVIHKFLSQIGYTTGVDRRKVGKIEWHVVRFL